MKRFWELFGVALGIIGIVISFYLYEISKRERLPTFIVEPIRTEIVNTKKLIKGIRILRNDSIEIKSDLTSIRFYFYNQGKESIKKENILSQITIKTDPSTKIIYSNLLKVSRTINQVQLKQIDSNKLNLEFNILEYNDGFTGELFVEGNSNTEINLEGEIEGVRRFKNVPLPFMKAIKAIALPLIFLILTIIGFFFNRKLYKELPAYSNNPELNNRIDNLRFQRKVNRIMILIFFVLSLISIIGNWVVAKREIGKKPSNYISAAIKP